MSRFPSTDAARAANSPVRHQYRVLTEAEKSQIDAIKTKGEELLAVIAEAPQGRETAIARTKTEEAVMWAVKAVTA